MFVNTLVCLYLCSDILQLKYVETKRGKRGEKERAKERGEREIEGEKDRER